jgi:hypothetical protein
VPQIQLDFLIHGPGPASHVDGLGHRDVRVHQAFPPAAASMGLDMPELEIRFPMSLARTTPRDEPAGAAAASDLAAPSLLLGPLPGATAGTSDLGH